MRRALLALAVVPLVLLAGCNADPYAGLPDEDQTAPASIQTVSPGDEGPNDWIRLSLVENDQDAYPFDEVNLRVVAPGNMERVGFACWTPQGTWHDGCQDAFQDGDVFELGDALWIPCAQAGNHRVTLEIGLNIIDGPARCEAGAGEEGPEQAQIQASTHDANGDGDVDWFELVLQEGDNAPYPPENVRATVEGPDGDAREDRLCATASGSWEDGCEAPFEDEDAWQEGSSLFVPCQDNGSHSVTVQIRGVTQLETGFFCDASA